MSSVRTYTLIYVLLLSLGTAKFVFFELPFTYEFAVGATLFLAVIKSLLIAGWYQHLVDEPRSITYVMLSAVFMVFLLAVAAGFSIQ